MTIYTFTSRTLTPSQNAKSHASGHWAVKHRAKKALQSAWAWDIALNIMPERPETLPRARVKMIRHSIRIMDEDNLHAGCKPLLDVLKPASKRNPHGMGLIADDSPEHITLDVRQVRVAKRAEQRMVVIVEPWFPTESVI